MRVFTYQPIDGAEGVEQQEYDEAPGSPEERAAFARKCSKISAMSDGEVLAKAPRKLAENKPLPTWGKTALYDGKTGEASISP
jgi:hypothetical protein